MYTYCILDKVLDFFFRSGELSSITELLFIQAIDF